MLAILSIFPMGKGTGGSLTKYVAGAVEEIAQSGLDYKVTGMGTIVEGEWDEVMRLVKRVRNRVLKKTDRVYLTLAIDDRKGRGRIASKVDSLEAALKRPLKR